MGLYLYDHAIMNHQIRFTIGFPLCTLIPQQLFCIWHVQVWFCQGQGILCCIACSWCFRKSEWSESKHTSLSTSSTVKSNHLAISIWNLWTGPHALAYCKMWNSGIPPWNSGCAFCWSRKDCIAIIMYSKWWCGYASVYRWTVNALRPTKSSLGITRSVSLLYRGPVLCSHWSNKVRFSTL